MRLSYMIRILLLLFATAQIFASPSFTENKGQIRDQHYQPRPDVLFSGSANGLYYHLKKDGLHYQLFRVESWKKDESRKLHLRPEERMPVPDKIGIYRVDINWLNTSPKTKIISEIELLGYNNYYNVPQNSRPALFVKSYESIRYQNIYNGIDLHFYNSEGNLEYDFLVQPHADYKQIQIQIKGATLKVSDKQELIIQTPFGDIVEGALKVYQAGKPIAANWDVRDNVVSFHIPKYDKTKPIRIDPLVRIWGTYVGGNIPDNTDWEIANSCWADAAGNVFAVGNTKASASPNIASTGAHQTSIGSPLVTDGYLIKLNPNGTRLWGTYYGGSFEDFFMSCATDNAGNVYAVGETQSTSNISTSGSYQPIHAGATDMMMVKFNANGLRQWGTYIGGNSSERANSVFVDGNNNIIVYGFGGSGSGIATPGTHQTTLASGSDAYILKFNSNGNKIWGTYFGGNNTDYATGCVADANGNIIINGFTISTSGVATAGSAQATYGGNTDMFLAKLTPNGLLSWATYLGGSDYETNYEGDSRPAVDAAGNIYITGRTLSFNGIARAGAFQPARSPSGGFDGFIAKYSPSGAKLWATYYGGNTGDELNAAATDAQNNVIVVGKATSPGLSTADAFQPNQNSLHDGIIVQFSPTGNLVYATYLGGNRDDEFLLSVYVHQPSGAVYVAGTTNSIVGAATSGVHQTAYGGGYGDGWITKLQDCPPLNIAASSNSPVCSGQNLNLSVSNVSSGTFSWTGPNGFTSSSQNPTITNATVAASGTYIVTVSSGGCSSASDTIQVTVNPSPAAPIANTLTPGVCKDSVARFEVTSAGTTFNWYATNTSTTILGTGTTFTLPPLQNSNSYFVERVENGCPSPRTQVFVQVIAAPDPTPANTSICAGTTATLNSNLTTGTVNWYNSPSATTPLFTSFSYTTPVLNANTTYYVQNFVSGCPSARVPVTVTVVTPPAAPTVNGATICAGQTATLNATAPSGVTFAWFTQASGGTAVFTGNPFTTPTLNNSTTYYAEAQVGTCNSTSRTAVTVTVNPLPTVNTGSNSPLCEGNDLNLTVNTTTNATYAWSGPNNFNSNQQNPTQAGVSTLATGVYVVTVTANGCSSSGSVSVTVNPIPTVNVSYNAPLCEGSDLNLGVSNTSGATYNWSGPAGFTSTQQNPVRSNIQTTQAGIYSVTVTANGCSNSGSVNVVVNSPANLNVTATASPATICAGQTTVLTASGATTYAWSNGLGNGATQNVSPQSTTTYTVTATDAGTGCTAAASATVTVNPLPNVAINASQTTLCESGTVTLTASGANTYQWSTGETTSNIIVSPTATTTYTVTGTDANGCSNVATQSINVLNFTGPQFPFGNNLTLCFGQTAPQLPSVSQNGITGVWQPTLISNTQSGTYTFTPNSGQCAADFALNVKVQQVSIVAGPDTLVDLATPVQLYSVVNGSSSGSYDWSPAKNLSCTNCANPRLFALQSEVFTVAYTDAQTGCRAFAEVNVEVNYDPNTVYYIPNSFSPNQDGSNDFFEVYGLKIKEVDLQIFNRWGELVFSEKSTSPKWDGYYKGELQNPDVFVYQTYITFYNGKTVKGKGSVTLIR